MADLVYLGPNDGIVYTGINGRIGIGTSLPTEKFQMDGGSLSLVGGISDYSAIKLRAGSSGGDTIRIIFRGDDNGEYGHVVGRVTTPSSGAGTALGGELIFRTATGGLLADRLIIKENGNVGIGTTNPTEKLEVNGNIKCANMTVTSWTIQVPDYVFDREHKLQRLEELSEYVHREKHLPEMPSADDMRSQGINLADMNLRLLKKVEELTLHLIEQNQRIKKLERTRIGTRIVNFLMRLVGL
jgi:hypothetical protein